MSTVWAAVAAADGRAVRFGPTRRPSELIIASHSQKWAAVRAQTTATVLEQVLAAGMGRHPKVPVFHNSKEKPGPQGALLRLPLWAHGDVALNTKDVRMERSKLRHRETIVAELEMWWECALRSSQTPDADYLDKANYIRVDRLIAKAMQPEYEPGEAHGLADEDWEEDSRSRRMSRDADPRLDNDESRLLSQAAFMDGLFELADVYTRTVDEAEYVRFLHELLERVASEVERRWHDEADVEYGGYAEMDFEEEKEPPSKSITRAQQAVLRRSRDSQEHEQEVHPLKAKEPKLAKAKPKKKVDDVTLSPKKNVLGLSPSAQRMRELILGDEGGGTTYDALRLDQGTHMSTDESQALLKASEDVYVQHLTDEEKPLPLPLHKASPADIMAFAGVRRAMQARSTTPPLVRTPPPKPRSYYRDYAHSRPTTPTAKMSFGSDGLLRPSRPSTATTTPRLPSPVTPPLSPTEAPRAFHRQPPKIWVPSETTWNPPRHYHPRKPASVVVQSELSNRLNCAEPRVHKPTPEEIPAAFMRKQSTRPNEPETPPPPEYQVLNRSVFVFEALGWKVGASSIFPNSTRQAPVPRAVGNFTSALHHPSAVSKAKTTFHEARAQGKGITRSNSSPVFALPVPGTCQIMNQEDYGRLGLRPASKPSPRPSLRPANMAPPRAPRDAQGGLVLTAMSGVNDERQRECGER